MSGSQILAVEHASKDEILWHVVLISFWSNVSEQERESIFQQYQALADECGGIGAGILSFKIEKNLDLRKNMHLVEIAKFQDMNALQAFRRHPAHKRLTDRLSQCATWYGGDCYGSP